MPQSITDDPTQFPVISDSLISSPGSESHGDRYIIAGIGGAWSSFSIGDIVEVVDVGPTVWQKYSPDEGDECYVKANSKYKQWSGTAWGESGAGATTLEGLGDVTSASPTAENVLAANGTNWATRALRAIYTLALNIGRSSFSEINRTSNKVQNIIIWTSSGKTQKIRETILTRSPVDIGKVQTVVKKQYNGAGTLIETLTKTLVRNPVTTGKVQTIDRVLS